MSSNQERIIFMSLLNRAKEMELDPEQIEWFLSDAVVHLSAALYCKDPLRHSEIYKRCELKLASYEPLEEKRFSVDEEGSYSYQEMIDANPEFDRNTKHYLRNTAVGNTVTVGGGATPITVIMRIK